MLQGLVSSAHQFLDDVRRSLFVSSATVRRRKIAMAAIPYAPLQHLLLTDGVGRTLFDGYARHRAESRGDEETGWVLLGLREIDRAVALAALPAGARRDAGVAHIRFNSTAQALASRIIRQDDRRLTILGVVHTHPGSLRHPSAGDLRGDQKWVGQLRGGEGIFAIGTADVPITPGFSFAEQPRANVQCLGDLRFSWYSLRQGEGKYRPLPVSFTLGPDLARDLHAVWATLEEHAERVERLVEQQAQVRIEVVPEGAGAGLVLTLPLARSAGVLRVLLRGPDARYFVERHGEPFEVEHHDPLVDRGVYALLARLAETP